MSEMLRIRIICIAIAVMFTGNLLAGCTNNIVGKNDNSVRESEGSISESVVEGSEPQNTNEDLDVIEETEITQADDSDNTSEREYIPDKSSESYYSLIDEDILLDVKTQQSGTCWTCAAASSMEGAYYKEFNEKVTFDASDICLKIYDDDKSEGWFVHRDKLDYGGWGWLVCDFLPNGYEGYYLKDARRYDEENSREELKNAIVNYGPLAISVCDNTAYKGSFDGYFTLNDDNPEHMDHEVIIIGWDDNFPKDYYKTPAKNDGAWICQNSKSKGWGDGGTYMVSYESPIDDRIVFSMTKEYSDIAYYDCGNEKQISTGETCSIANVYNKKGTLAAVGTYTNEDYQKYKIEVRDGEFGEIISEADGTADIKGYHVVDLPTPVEVEKYTVVITFEGLAPVEGESYELDGGAVSYVAGAEAGQSFVLINDEWIDMSTKSAADKLDIDFVPNNACIKALYID